MSPDGVFGPLESALEISRSVTLEAGLCSWIDEASASLPVAPPCLLTEPGWNPGSCCHSSP